MSIQQEKIKELVERRAKARMGGGQKRIDAQHAKGKFTARRYRANAKQTIWSLGCIWSIFRL